MAAGVLMLPPTAAPQSGKSAAAVSDIPNDFHAPVDKYDYIRREVMIPMRDGVKLFTVIIMPKGAKNAPILLTRTPYNAAERAQPDTTARTCSPRFPKATRSSSEGGYIRVFQDVRGKYGSEGDYVMTRPSAVH